MRRGSYPWGTLGFLLVCAVGLVGELAWLVATHDPAAGRVFTLIGLLVVLVGLAAVWRGRRLLRRHDAVVRLRPGCDVRTAVGDASLPWHVGRLGGAPVAFPQGDRAVAVALNPGGVELWRGDEPVLVLSLAVDRITQVTVQHVRAGLLPVPGVVLEIGDEQIALAPIRREGGVRTARRADVEAWATHIAQHVGAGTGPGGTGARA